MVSTSPGAASAAKSLSDVSPKPASGFVTFSFLQREVTVGLSVALTILGTCLAAGVLVFSPLGPDYVRLGAAAGIYGAVIGGACAALAARSSFILWTPQTTIGLVQASLAASLMADPNFMHDRAAAEIALIACVALTGVLQILFGVAGLARIIKYTPHPVLAGFMNGVSISILLAQIKQFLPLQSWLAGHPADFLHPVMLVFVLALVAFVFWFETWTKKIAAPIVGLLVGFICYHVLHFLAPGLDLGPTLGRLPVQFPPPLPLAGLLDSGTRATLAGGLPSILSIAAAMVVVGTFQSLLAFRMAENFAGSPIPASRGLVALGFGDIASSAVGGLALSVAVPQTAAAFRGGGRTRAVGLTVSLSLLLLAVLLPDLLGAIPLSVIIASLIVVSISVFDRWSIAQVRALIKAKTAAERRRICYDLAVVLVVMGVIVTTSVVPGILAGFVAACLTFVMRMSKPIVQRRMSGSHVHSKRVWAHDEAAHLQETGERRRVLSLNGVLFFGNAETLSREVLSTFNDADVVIVDCRGVSDIDASGANIIRELADKSRKLGKLLLFCNVPPVHQNAVSAAVGTGKTPSLFTDLDSALEWSEERDLATHDRGNSQSGVIELAQHDFLRSLSSDDCQVLALLLQKKTFAKGTQLAAEGEAGDRMWLIGKGSVDIRLRVEDARGSRRIASLATGTTVGEMALIENAARSASIIAAEDVECWELDRATYETIMRDYPHIGARLLTNLFREMANRLRNTSDQLRESES
ncbi:MAG: SulP family inorganic anion transporter [Xanthobacteraceae bacterium]|jgi:MFS superfamily sulfate permease-like transporter